MDFVWDDAKGEANLEKHGVDFKDGARGFLDRHRIERLDTQHYYGEDLYQTIGMVDGRVPFRRVYGKGYHREAHFSSKSDS